jgi:ribonucleoside-diphosphate reductase beta chain
MTFDKSKEILLKENPNRFVLFPIIHNDLWALYKTSLSAFWTSEEIDFSGDIKDWNKLNNNEKFFIKNILAFFAVSDGIVNENLILNFYNEIQIPEARNLYATQIMMEAIHSETYSLLIDTYISNPEEKDLLFRSIETNPIIKKKCDWGIKWITNGTFPERLLAFGAIEGIFFSGSFCAIFWLKSRGLMPGMSMANQFISRDESLHCKTCCLLYSKLEQRLPESRVHSIFKEAYEIEEEFITKSIPVNLIGMNNELMCSYIKFITDYWLVELGYSKLFNATNPFPFMDFISLENKVSFFEARVSQYSKAGVGKTEEENSFSMDAEF